MASQGDNNLASLQRRLRRLEALVAVLVVDPETVPPPYLDEFFYRLFRHEMPDDEFWMDLRLLLRRGRQNERWANLLDRVVELESSIEAATETRKLLPQLELRISDDLNKLNAEHQTLQQESHHWLVLQSLGLDLRDVPLPRFLQVRVYLAQANNDTTTAVSAAVQEALSAFDFTIADDFPARQGSWFKSWFVKSKDVLTLPQVQERLQKLERAAEIQGLLKPQSEVDKTQAQAVAILLKALPANSDAAFQVGSLLIVHIANDGGHGCTQVRTLTQRELILLEKHQDMLAHPRDLMRQLSDAAKGDGDVTAMSASAHPRHD